jgi:NAD+ kinase
MRDVSYLGGIAMSYKNIGCIASRAPQSQRYLKLLVQNYGILTIDEEASIPEGIDVVVILGGDGFMLHSLHRIMHLGIPIYGMNAGSIGFLMNSFSEKDLITRLSNARPTIVRPLQMKTINDQGEISTQLAINEVSLLRQTNQAAHIKISIDGLIRLDSLVSDGILVSTSAGSSAYNLSAGGPIIPIGSNMLAITAICPFRPRRWRGALLPSNAKVGLHIIDYNKRPVSATADFKEIRNITRVEIQEEQKLQIQILFDADHSLEDRIIREQFTS